MEEALWVRPFDEGTFNEALARNTEANADSREAALRPSAADVADHPQSKYLYRYLTKELAPRTIVVETPYVDGDYLADYTSFYATVYARFDRFCKRVHFFSHTFDEKRLREYLLRSAEQAEMQQFSSSYLGFTVIKPLPEAFIGRTVLKHYPDDGQRRHYTAVVPTDVNLYGFHLRVERSLPFQQQDSVVSACATVALWSCFHRAVSLWGTATKRPAEITRAATLNVFQERVFPSQGLTLSQMCSAIRDNDLEPEVFILDPSVPVLSWIRSYLESGIPVVLGIQFPDNSRHAIAAVGYRLEDTPVRQQEAAQDAFEPPGVGRRISELYCHDDNLGPFARFRVTTNAQSGAVELTSDYVTDADPTPLRLTRVIVPLYHKIRLSFPDVQGWVSILDQAVREILDQEAASAREWDINLATNNTFKDEIQQANLTPDDKLALLVEAQPRFVWQMILRIKNVEYLRIHADATSFARSFPLRRAIFFEPNIGPLLVKILQRLAQVSTDAAILLQFLERELALGHRPS